MASGLPSFILCMPSESLAKATLQALDKHLDALDRGRFTIIEELLSMLPEDTTFDCIVSPANSYARLDGGFDHAISMQFAPRDDYHALTRASQKAFYERWRGYAPPGTCTLVPIPPPLRPVNRFGCAWVAFCPTMRTPEDVRWNKEVVYDCVWSLLNELWAHNRKSKEEERIGKVLMPGLGTGIGNIPSLRFAHQLALAVKHFSASLANPERWSALGWTDVMEETDAVEETHTM